MAAARAGSFQCASVSTGNGCQLMLTYAPTVLGSGTLTLNYAYDDDAGVAQTGTLDLPYDATTNDNVIATPSPSGQINAVVGMGTQTVAVVFTTDDGRLATDLQLTSSLADAAGGLEQHREPLGVHDREQRQRLSADPYLQSAGGRRRYADARTTATRTTRTRRRPGRSPFRIARRTNDTVAGTPSPSSSLAVLTGTSTPVTVAFATDDGNPASNLTITSGLSALPAGWSELLDHFQLRDGERRHGLSVAAHLRADRASAAARSRSATATRTMRDTRRPAP